MPLVLDNWTVTGGEEGAWALTWFLLPASFSSSSPALRLHAIPQHHQL